MRPWYPNELDTAGPEHLDADYVAGYDAKAGYDPTDDVDLLVGSGLDASSTVVDLGAGTGTFALAMAERVRRVIAVDPSPAMAAALRARGESVSTLTVQQAGFLSWEFDESSVDAVFSRNALHQLPDLWKATALRRIAAALRPAGTLRLRDLVFDFGPDEIDEAVEAWLSFAGDDAATGYTAPEFVEHLQREFSTYSWLLEPMLERTGFEILDVTSTIGIYAAYTCRLRP